MSEQRPLPPLSEQTDDKGPRAFPISADEFYDRGMTLRDWFAGQALAGFLAAHGGPGVDIASSNDAAEAAYDYADAMLRERKK